MKILAIDQGTKMGWAFYDGSTVTSGVQDFSLKRGESPGMRWIHFKGWLKNFLNDVGEITMLVHEQAHHRGGAATEVAAGFVTHMQAFVAENGIQISSVHSGTLKKFITGSGSAKKKDMIEAAVRLYKKEVSDDNEADALCILSWAMDNCGISYSVEEWG